MPGLSSNAARRCDPPDRTFHAHLGSEFVTTFHQERFSIDRHDFSLAIIGADTLAWNFSWIHGLPRQEFIPQIQHLKSIMTRNIEVVPHFRHSLFFAKTILFAAPCPFRS